MGNSRVAINPVDRRMRLLAVLSGFAAAAAGTVFSGRLASAEGIPLILGAVTAGQWPRLGKGLVYFGAIWVSCWILPFAALAIVPAHEPHPNLMVIIASLAAVLFIVWLDVALLIVTFKGFHSSRSAERISSPNP
jgi:hypothetical protein